MMMFQSGKYNEPEWLSADSKRLIKSMLQTDPKKRISIEKLVCDPWLTAGYDRPISKDNVCDVSKIHTVIELYTFCA
jgi:serine/threonine protein kinase